ncbi:MULTISPECIES: hypothetical protein [unclassified Frondihabitans]|uniref:hypothetical protein n=1 Tax=unclassified Frondihabitans TaxID=2626248 RepID=UPI0013159048|nr:MULTISPECIES: hypothetical protein [unclassified Frondihabitans]
MPEQVATAYGPVDVLVEMTLPSTVILQVIVFPSADCATSENRLVEKTVSHLMGKTL